LRVHPLDGDDARRSIEVAAFERDAFLRPQSSARGEHTDRGEAGMELRCDQVHFLPRLERLNLGTLRLRVLDVAGIRSGGCG